jgi:hypothetical protein
MTHLANLAIVVFGCCCTSVMAQAPADVQVAEFYCTGEAWGLGAGTDAVETDAYLRVGSKSSRLEISGFGAGTINGPLKVVNAITRSGTVRLALGADNNRQHDRKLPP